MNKEEHAAYVKQYQKDNVKKYGFKINYKTEDVEFLTLWDLVKNKSACIKFCLTNKKDIFDYLLTEGYTEKEIYHYIDNSNWDQKQNALKEKFNRELSAHATKEKEAE